DDRRLGRGPVQVPGRHPVGVGRGSAVGIGDSGHGEGRVEVGLGESGGGVGVHHVGELFAGFLDGHLRHPPSVVGQPWRASRAVMRASSSSRTPWTSVAVPSPTAVAVTVEAVCVWLPAAAWFAPVPMIGANVDGLSVMSSQATAAGPSPPPVHGEPSALNSAIRPIVWPGVGPSRATTSY